jgi:hypothetical protein
MLRSLFCIGKQCVFPKLVLPPVIYTTATYICTYVHMYVNAIVIVYFVFQLEESLIYLYYWL